jgi:cyclohexanone monooxygenase
MTSAGAKSKFATNDSAPAPDFDVVIVGAGVAGLYALHHLRGRGLNVRLYEAASGVGGTWFWNRYPGARVDIDSLEYSYSFSEELQQEWEWSERYASQAELLRYLNHVADRFDLTRSITFDTRIQSATYDEASSQWVVETNNGETVRARYCVMATGFLSAPNKPDVPGLDNFKGQQYHTAFWPHEGVDFTGLRVAVVGTGSSGVQSIPIIAEQAAHLTVFQRTPPFSVPLLNCPMPEEYQKRVKLHYAEWRRKQRYESFGGWMSVNYEAAPLITELAMDQTSEARRALYEDRWKSGGLAFFMVYPDIFYNRAANETLAEFLREKIRERINDPELAELLVPKDYPVLTKRLCCDNGYYETYNRDNVKLVDVRSKPIESVVETGIRVGGIDHEFDAIVWATGFDALTGALTRMTIRGRDGRLLNDHWADGPRTALGMMSAGFPNLFFLNGPGSPSPTYHPILLGEEQVDWVGDCIAYLDRHNLAGLEPTPEVEQEWIDHSTESVNQTLFPLAASWYMGANIPGKPRKAHCYFGGVQTYRERCASVAASGYADFLVHHRGETPTRHGAAC